MRGAALEWVAVPLAALVALACRVANFGPVFGGGRLQLTDIDSWHHLRLIQNLVHHYPHRLAFDPFAAFPGGQELRTGPLLDLLVGGVALLVGGGSPSEHLVEVVAAAAPPVLGALAVVPMYFLARALFGRTAAILTALAMATCPGELMRRGVLGYVDHHVLEVLTSACVLWLVVVALDEGAPRRRLRLASLAGLALGAYLITWTSGSFLVAMLLVWLAIAMAVRHARGLPLEPLAVVAACLFGVALLPVLPYARAIPKMDFNVAVLLGGLAAVALALGLSRAGVPRRVYPLALVGALGAFVLALWIARPAVVAAALRGLGRLVPQGGALTIHELGPLPLSEWWREYALVGVAAVPGVALLCRRVARAPSDALLLLVVMVPATLAATLLQRRFSYYFAMQACLLCGLAGAWLCARFPRRWVLGACALALLLAGLGEPLRLRHETRGVPEDWLGALAWLRSRTPEPLGPDAFFARAPAHGVGYVEPASAYGVLSAWDAGHWITYLARRIPITNPTQVRAAEASRALLEEDPVRAVADARALGARYVVVDARMTMGPDRWVLPGIAAWAGRKGEDFVEQWFARSGDALEPVVLFHPAFYRAFQVRLHAFGGRAYTPHGSTWVVRGVDRVGPDGPYKELVERRSFPTFEEGARFAEAHPGTRLVGAHALASPVPLEAVPEVRLVYESPERRRLPTGGGREAHLPTLRIFELSR